jgi:hypothetical protein
LVAHSASYFAGAAYPWLAGGNTASPEDGLRLIVDAKADDPEAIARMDAPLSFAKRYFSTRYVKELSPVIISKPNPQLPNIEWGHKDENST